MNLSNNKLGSLGFAEVMTELLNPESGLVNLDIGYNDVEEIRLKQSLDASLDKICTVTNLVMDGNVLKSYAY